MTQTVPPPPVPDDLSEEALFPEARQLRRRRWTIRSLIVALACVIAGLVIAILNTGRTGSHRATGFAGGAPPAGALTTLHLAGALAVAHNGDLYVADTPDVGNSPLQTAIGPGGQVYISNGVQVLRLTPEGTLDPVKATVAPAYGLPGGQLNGIGQIAVAPNGTIYVGGLMRGWSLSAIEPAGTARYLTYARQNGGNTVDVQSGPHGNVYAASGDGILLINHGNPRMVFEFKHNVTGQYFELTNFAITSNGVIYADEIPGGYGFEAHQQLVAVRTQHVTLLWQETNRAPR
jgi:hypothetical protein